MFRLKYVFRASLVLLVGALLGIGVGWLVFSVSSLTGKSLFVAGGGLIGLIMAALVLAYSRGSGFLTVSEIKLSIPELGEMKFAINLEYRRVAWKLFVETITRVATQPLIFDEGSLREALTSLYSLFEATRELLKNMPPSRPSTDLTVELLATRMLNHEIRPFLTKWHVRLKKFESMDSTNGESAWPENQECRTELEVLRTRLITYATAFGKLAGVANLNKFFGE